MLEELQVGEFGVRVLVLLTADGQGIDIPPQGRAVASVENLRLEGKADDLSRLLISLTARADAVAWPATRGTSGACSQRLTWAGDVPFADATGTPGSPAQGRRAGGFVRTRLVREKGAAEWRLCMLPVRIKGLTISARVERVDDLDGDLEAAFGVPPKGL